VVVMVMIYYLLFVVSIEIDGSIESIYESH